MPDITYRAHIDRRPIFLIGSLSNREITDTNPTGLDKHWQDPPDPGWLYGLIASTSAERVMLSDPAGWTAPAGQVRWPHWWTLSDLQRDEMAYAALWLNEGVSRELTLYAGRKISPPDDLDWNAHVLPTSSFEHQQWINQSLQPYFNLGFTGLGLDASSSMDDGLWRGFLTMIRSAAGKNVKVFNEALRKRGLYRGPQLCQWNFFTAPGRMENPDFSYDPARTEVHCVLTAAEALVPGRVAALQAKGIIVGCKNQFWITTPPAVS